MDAPKKCAHPACNCMVHDDTFGEFCSAHCQEADDMPEIRCECGHPECNLQP
ncbi:MAG TPA: hypothetical protein VFO19_14505 [Vicinamibacterales bacterium]|nr:hypothetical protein [Vicinamibacterales bacterium]